MATIDLGKVAFVWKGTYASGTTYESKDVVQYTDSGETSSYVYVNASSASGQTPSTSGTVNTTYWAKMAGGSSGIWASGLSLGTANQVVKVNAGATALEFGDAGGGLQSVQAFTTAGSHTYTKPSGIKKIRVYITGAGGGGGGSASGYTRSSGSGAASGGTAIKLLDATSITTVSVTIGAGGSGNSNGNTGATGGTSSFGSHCSATGGEGGNSAANYGPNQEGGTATGGDLNLNGGGANYSMEAGGGAITASNGANSYWGGAGPGDYSSVGHAGHFGGGGGGGSGNAANNAGGTGGAGVCYVEEYK